MRGRPVKKLFRQRVVLIAVMLAAGRLCAQKTVYITQEPDCGIAPIPAELNEWRTGAMTLRDPKPTPADVVVTGDDFFTREYGAPFSVEFNTGTNGWTRIFGTRGCQPKEVSIRFGRGWGRQEGRKFQLQMDIEQSVAETEWDWAMWENGTRHKVPFKLTTSAGKRSRVVQDLGVVRMPQRFSGVELTCRTKNVHVKILSAKIVPVTVPMTWRGIFVLGFDPWRAGMTLARRNNYTLSINGTELSRGLSIDGGETLKMEIGEHLKKGTNIIEVVTEYHSGYADPGALLTECFAVSATGETTFLLAGPDWRVRVGDGPWLNPHYSRNPKSRAGFETLPSGKQVATGNQPMHGGPLQVCHLGPKFPVFDCEDKTVEWQVSLPPRMTEATVACVVSNAITGEVAERLSQSVAPQAGQHSTTAVFRLASRETGAYKLYWTLARGADVLDRVRTEMIVAGPVEQTAVPFNEFDNLLESRMKVIQTRDCTVDELNPTNFAQYRGSAVVGEFPAEGLSRVGREGGLVFRETGERGGDWFGYKLDVEHLGRAHILEVDYPDTREQLLYVRVCESYPIHFCNNTARGGSGHANASGAVRTGWMEPLTGKKEKLRILFYPGSKNITVTFENGGLGQTRAAVCGFRLYEVPEGVPALELPPTDRLYGNHCERPLCGMWGASVASRFHYSWTEAFENVYAAAFAAAANRIRFLRYSGQNLAIEGVYMYKQGFPTLSGESYLGVESFDFNYVLSKMYRRNGIRAFACFEYIASPAIMLGGGYDIGDSEMRAAKGPLAPSYSVSRYGKQVVGFGGMGLNYLAPHVWRSITNLVTEIYGRYEPTGGFEGLFMINNGWWIPGFPAASGDRLSEREVGYDDLSVTLFEKDTGISLGIPYTPERFEKRYEVLNSKHAQAWYAWRARKMRESLETIGDLVAKGENKWAVYASPGIRRTREDSPFDSIFSTAEERDTDYPRLLAEAGFPSDLYGRGTDAWVTLVPRVAFARAHDLKHWGAAMNAGARAIYAKQDAVYFDPTGLNERWTSTSGLDAWWWRAAGSTVFDVKPSGTGAFFDMVDVCADHTPTLMIHTWLDVNYPTAHGREGRRFATGFLASPVGDYTDCPSVCGVQARRCGDAVQLVNDTPYALEGVLRSKTLGLFPHTVEDAFAGKKRGTFPYALEPYGITVLKGCNGSFSGEFRFADAAVAEQAMARTDALLANKLMCAKIKPQLVARLQKARLEKDAYTAVATLRDFEVRRVADAFFDHVITAKNTKPASELKVIGRYDGAEPKRFKAGEPGQGLGAVDAKYKSATRARTLSLLVKTGGSDCAILLHDTPLRYDLRVSNGGLNAAGLVFRVKPGQKGYFSYGLKDSDSVAANEWHHLCWTVDPEGSATLWVDGDLVDAVELDALHGVALDPASGGLNASRPTVPEGKTFADILIAREIFREGVMDWRDIQKEAAEWLGKGETK